MGKGGVAMRVFTIYDLKEKMIKDIFFVCYEL